MREDIERRLGVDPPSPSWLVPGIIPEGAIVILAGDPGVGKSALSYSLSLAVSIGGKFLSQFAKPGRVLYFDEENSEQDFHSYLDTLWRGLDCPAPAEIARGLFIERFTLGGALTPYGEMSRLVDDLQPSLVVIDTATPACRIEDENSNGEASAAIRRLRMLKARVASSTFLILKHARVDSDTGQRDIRGAKAWKGEADAVLFHTQAQGRPPLGAWRRTRLTPGKVRAYGLRDPMLIVPVKHNGGYRLTGQIEA